MSYNLFEDMLRLKWSLEHQAHAAGPGQARILRSTARSIDDRLRACAEYEELMSQAGKTLRIFG